MTGNLTIPAIAQHLDVVAIRLVNYCAALSDEQFFFQPQNKWSAAQQVKHLIVATNTSRLALTLPKFVVRWVGGKPNRDSRSYEELVQKYKTKLAEGGKASGRYIPKPILPSYGKQKLLTGFTTSMHQFGLALRNRWKEHQPDEYLAPHPLLGKITLRELCYFTIHHAEHHLQTIQDLNANAKLN